MAITDGVAGTGLTKKLGLRKVGRDTTASTVTPVEAAAAYIKRLTATGAELQRVP